MSNAHGFHAAGMKRVRYSLADAAAAMCSSQAESSEIVFGAVTVLIDANAVRIIVLPRSVPESWL